MPVDFGVLQSIRLEQIRPNIDQPRQNFDDEKLQELAQSIRMNGLLQPITVSETGHGQYRIIAGERRWRAAGLAGLSEIAAVVRTVQEQQVLELALIENIQREDLNPIEVATAFQRLTDQHGLSHEQIGERTGKDRSTISNFLRLLRLSPFVQNALRENTVSFGHARALLQISDHTNQDELCRHVMEQGLSVRETERQARELYGSALPKKRTTSAIQNKEEPFTLDPNVKAALDEMATSLGTKIKLFANSPTSGRLEIEYYSQEDLDRIYAVITRQ